jgi:yersiniabactin nonribosomal peptide synthetase
VWDAVDALFPDGLIDQMFTAYTQFIEWLVADNNDWQFSLNVLPSAQQQIRDTDVELSIPLSTQCLHTSFFDFAAANPQQTALIDSHSNTHLTYGEAAKYALQVAALLKEHGVMQGDPVAVTLPRGIEQIAAVFGILALGACYAPVSVEQPSVRRDRIHKKAAIRYVLTNHEQAQTIAWLADAVVLDIANTANTTALAEPVEVSPERLAYIIFTSGSTGEPKGVEISHCAAWNTIAEINRRYNVSATDRILAVSSLDFDLSVYDIFGLLSVGGSLLLITEDTRRDAAHWLKLLNRYQVTIWNSVPVLLDMLLVVAESEQQKTLPLRLTLLSGDWIGLDLPTRLHSVAEHCHLVAMGGATEASIWSNFFDVTLPLPAHWTSIPYGRPLANQAYRVVDSKGRDCPDWVAGELWIGGAGVAQGYRGDPKLTAERFVKWNGSRWYRTGDLGRYLPDRNIEFLGREDFQVKIRGHRIELGEIESALGTSPEVQRAVVVTEGEPPSLAAAVVLDEDSSKTENEISARLRTFLAKQLPEYMVPKKIIVLNIFPLNVNGKVDRTAIVQTLKQSQITSISEPPRDALERQIATIWMEILQIQELLRGDNFFLYGGDSLKATRIIEQLQIQQVAPSGISLGTLFDAPTVATLAEQIRIQWSKQATEQELQQQNFEEVTL